jgi:calcium-dependent protein kinase
MEMTVLGPDAARLNVGNYYALERVLKNSIFGCVYHVTRVVRAGQGEDVFRQVVPIQEFAVKVYDRGKISSMRGQTQENPFNEISAMQFVFLDGGHVNVVRQVECLMDRIAVYSVLEFCKGGELYDVVDELTSSGRTMGEVEARRLFVQIMLGLQHLHKHGVAHRDMSLENVLLLEDGTCKIIDLGMCLRMNGPLPMPNQVPCGKKNYIAPEVLAQVNPFSPIQADMWGAGIILFILLTGLPLCEFALDLDPRFRMVRNGQLDGLLTSWGFTELSLGCVDLLKRMLQVNPSDRPTAEETLQHPWVIS